MSNLICTASREKYWSEITADERIARLRSELKRTQRRCEEQGKLIAKLVTRSEAHEHGANGRPVMPLDSSRHEERDEAPLRGTQGDDCFF